MLQVQVLSFKKYSGENKIRLWEWFFFLRIREIEIYIMIIGFFTKVFFNKMMILIILLYLQLCFLRLFGYFVSFFNETISLKICITEICFVEITATWWGSSKLLNGGDDPLFMFCWTYWGTTNFRKSVILGSSKDLLLEWTTICQKILILG